MIIITTITQSQRGALSGTVLYKYIYIYIYINIYITATIYIYIWRYGLPWHKVLNAGVAEQSLHKLKNHCRQYCIGLLGLISAVLYIYICMRVCVCVCVCVCKVRYELKSELFTKQACRDAVVVYRLQRKMNQHNHFFLTDHSSHFPQFENKKVGNTWPIKVSIMNCRQIRNVLKSARFPFF